MYKMPQITNEEAKTYSNELGINLVNKAAWYGPSLALKGDSGNIDTDLSYIDKRYAAILEQFNGKVLVLGLGFGCNIIRACQKKSVSKVVVIEQDEAIIKLFWLIHGKFKGHGKLEIIQGDGVKLNLSSREFDHVFIDMFHTPLDFNWYKIEMDKLKDRYKTSVNHIIDLGYGK